mmetsp:Transcript_14763/g.42005  ORF Transcript_14763/g.42005 Transcript_14763/m.42005 type:complete len:228 (-) Transcript_14763:2495-3178(-)
MKATWLRLTLSPSRSHSGDISTSYSRSRSPCAKLSLMKLSAKRLAMSQSFAWAEMSAAFSAILSAVIRSLESLRSKASGPPKSFALTWATKVKCWAISVARTSSMTIFLNSNHLSVGQSCWNISKGSSLYRSWKARAQCILSLMALSLKMMLSGSCIFMRKSFVTPVCSKSWMRAANSTAKTSRSVRAMASRNPPWRTMKAVVWTTSLTWTALWYGFGGMPISIRAK